MTIENEAFLPEDLSVARPLLIALHGGGRDSQSQLDLWKPLAAAGEFIVLAPNSLPAPFPGATWLWSDNGQHLADKVSEALNHYPVDRRRIYCFGHSAGATKALDWGFHNRHCMAAVALHSPMQAQGIYQLNGGPGPRRLPVGIWSGAESSDGNWHCASALEYAYKEHPNVAVFLTVIPNHEHNGIYTRPGLTGEIWAFLKQHTL